MDDSFEQPATPFEQLVSQLPTLKPDSRSSTLSRMKDRLTIGELANAASVPASTVRYYERTGLLRRPPRSASNYRLHGEEDVYRVRFIRAAQATGLTLDDVAELLRPSPCRKVQGRIERRLAEVSSRLKELRHAHRNRRGHRAALAEDQTDVFAVKGMTCALCGKAIEKSVREVEGVCAVRLDQKTERVTVVTSVELDRAAIIEASESVGSDTANPVGPSGG